MKKVFTLLLISFFYLTEVKAQINHLLGPTGSENFGKSVTVLTNGNYVVTDPLYDEGITQNVGAVYLYNGTTHTLISTLKGSRANDQVGSNISQPGVVALSNGNFLVCSNQWDNGTIVDAGAVTWVNGSTGLNGVVSSTNSLVGSSTYDQIGVYGILKLTNGNYVVNSPNWDNGSLVDVGAVTWCNGATGLSGTISTSNSITGSKANDLFGYYVTALTNGNYVICSPEWDNGTITDAGAITWCSGIVATTGIAGTSNSLVGSKANDLIGNGLNNGFGGVTPLTNGNYVVCSPNWDNGTAVDAGAVTWAIGTSVLTGTITSSNSLVGSKSNDLVGNTLAVALPSGNYVVVSKNWGNGSLANAGAVTWGNGTTGTFGVVSSTNSLVGSKADDQVGYIVGQANGITVLTNGNYVINSPFWDNGTTLNVGAVTWASGTSGIVGTISSANSLIGVTAESYIGSSKTVALTNGNYIIVSPDFDNGSIADAGAVTWGNGATGTVGTTSSAGIKSLVGGKASDLVGSGGVVALANGNYVVCSPYWDNGTLVNVGAVTWCNGATGGSGAIATNISMMGSVASDFVGINGVFGLPNSNYIILSPYCNIGTIVDAGAITWCNGTTGGSGFVSATNSLVGAKLSDQIGSGYFAALDNSNYVVTSPNWDNNAIVDAGAATWFDGSVATIGNISTANSLIGSKANDLLGNFGVSKLSANNYILKSSAYANGLIAAAGAITYGIGTTGTFGTINSCNSIIGLAANGASSLLQNSASIYNATNNYFISGRPADNMLTIYNPTAQTLVSSLDSNSVNLITTNNTQIIGSVCNLIATITANGASPAAGAINSKVWIESTQPSNFVRRHHQIVAVSNNSTATARLTLYFTQAEFDAFNSINTVKLPINATDAAGKANLLVERRIGVTNNNTGMPATYTGTIANIDPVDADINWNATNNRWEVTFDAVGLGGFFVKTQTTSLPLTLISFTGSLNNQATQLNWKTSFETNLSHFDIEYGNDGVNFSTVGKMNAVGGFVNNKNYQFNHTINTQATHYYRLKIIDQDGKYQYSNIIRFNKLSKANSLQLYPTVTSNTATAIISSFDSQVASLSIVNSYGQIVHSQQVQLNTNSQSIQLNLDKLSSGVYKVVLRTSQSILYQTLIKQ